MSYLVFARKWRPQSFDEVLAQEHVTTTLKNAIENGRIGHSYLMTGPRGVGKTTIARIFAKALNCEKGPTSTPCQVCDSCHSITAGNHMDVREIDGASNRGIDQIRDLREQARYATASGRYKIYIIDEVHMLTNEAFNALLKILEEPPDSVVFIFATTQPRKVPDTILSRCQRFDLRRIPMNDMSNYLKSEAAGEGISLDDSALSLICRASGGSLRDALSLMDQLVSFSGNDIRGEEVARLLGMVESDLLAAITAAVLAGDASAAIDRVSIALADGYSVDELMDAFMSFLRNLLLVAAGASESLREVPESELKHLKRLSADLPDIAVLNGLRIISGAAAEIKRSNLPRITLETAVMTASKLSRAFDLHDLPGVARNLSASAVDGNTADAEDVPVPGNGIHDAPEDDGGAEARDAAEETEDAGEEGTETASNEDAPGEHETESGSDTVEDESAADLNPQESNPEEGDGEKKVQEKVDEEKVDREKEKETSQEILGLFDAV